MAPVGHSDLKVMVEMLEFDTHVFHLFLQGVLPRDAVSFIRLPSSKQMRSESVYLQWGLAHYGS